MRYGYFDDDRREYVITRPDTPVPWINYLGTDEHFGTVSNTAGGYSWHLDARLRRLTRYRYNNVPGDAGGRYLYLRDDGTGEYWSPSWQPTRTPLDSYECRHGLSYTTIKSARAGITAKTVYFVPRGENLEVWRVAVTNDRETTAELSLFSSVEFALWDAQDDATNYQRNYSTGEVEVADGVIYHKTEYRERRDHFAYFACSEPLAGFDTQREAFLGPYRGFHEPLGVERGKLTNSIAHGWSPHGAHHVRLTLEPGETREVIFLLGYWENPRDAKFESAGVISKASVRPVIDRWLDPLTVRDAFADLKAYWDGLLGVLHVDTPDTDSNRMVSIWNAYQCMVTFNLSRSVSSYETGISRGMGFRDSCQDLLGAVQLAPERSRERILDLAATQFASGGAYHQYQPLTKTGNDAIGSGFNDDPLWLVLGVAAYLKETGDTTDPRRARPVQRRGRSHPLRPPGTVRPVHPRPDRPARPAAHRPRRLERLPEPQLLLRHPGRVLPDHGEPAGRRRRVRVHRRPVHPRRQGTRGHRGAHRPRRRGGRLPRRRGEDGRRDRRARLGRRAGSCAPTTTSATRSAPRRTRRARSSSSRRACASWRESATAGTASTGRTTAACSPARPGSSTDG